MGQLLLNTPEQQEFQNQPNNCPIPTADVPGIKLGKITIAEVDDTITTLNRNKTPGPDYAMTAEVLKDGGEFVVNQLHNVCQLVYENLTAQWKSSLIKPIPNKGNPQLMPNY